MNNNQPRNIRRRSRVSTKHKVIVAVILVLYAAILATATYFLLHKPQSDDRQFIEYVTDEEGNTIEITHDFEAVSGSYNILLLGQDKEAMLTDVIMIMNINNNNGSVTVMQIPRDTYVKSTDGVSIITNKANELFVDHFNYYRNVQGEGENKAYKHALETMSDLLADSLCIALYRSQEAGAYLRRFSFLIPMLYCDAITDAMTKGLGQQKACVRYNILTSSMDVALLYILLPKFGMQGYFFSFLVTHLINFVFSLRRLFKITGKSIRIRMPVLSFLAVLAAALVASFGTTAAIKAVSYTALLCSLLFLLKVLKKEDIFWVKGLIKL